MARSQFRRSLRFENLEGRQLLSSGGPTNQEQYMLAVDQRGTHQSRRRGGSDHERGQSHARRAATLKYYNVNLQQVEQTIANATPQAPLAWNQNLANAAQGQSQYEADTQTQTHTGANGSTTQQRIEAAGYTNSTSSGENTYAYASSVMEAMQAFLIDWGVPSDGHRINIQQPGVSAQNAYTSVGIGIVQTSPPALRRSGRWSSPRISAARPIPRPRSSASPITTPAARVSTCRVKGQGGVQIDAVNLQTGAVSSTQTWASGGYELPLAPGQYRIIASLNDKVIQASNVTVNNLNIEQDFILTNTWQGGTREAAIAAAQPPVAPPVTIPTTPATPTPDQRRRNARDRTTNSQPSSVLTLTSMSSPSSFLSLFANSWSAWNAG